MQSEQFEAHNQLQVEYFSNRLKTTMIPGTTPYVIDHIQKLVEVGRLSKGDRLLDVGCGMGRYTIPLAQLGYTVEGLDLTPALLERFRDFETDTQVPLHCLDIVDRPPEMHEAFDAIVGFFTLHHIHNLTASFEAMKHYLKPGGSILFLEPNAWNPLYYIQITFSPDITWKGDGGIVRMTHKYLLTAARQAGLEQFALHRFGMLPPFLKNKSYGPSLERTIEKILPGDTLLAFQIVEARKPSSPQ